MPKKKTAVRREWTKDDVRTLKVLQHHGIIDFQHLNHFKARYELKD